MSRYSYGEPYRNPTEDWEVREHEGRHYVYVPSKDGGLRKHDAKWNVEGFEDADMAFEYIDSLHQTFEDDYESYLEENRHSIVEMERYEMFMREQ